MVAGRSGMKLEALKFGIYIGIPVVASALFNEPETIQWFVDYFQYIEYPVPASADSQFRQKLEAQVIHQQRQEEQRTLMKEQLQALDQLANQNKNREHQDLNSNSDSNSRWFRPRWIFGARD